MSNIKLATSNLILQPFCVLCHNFLNAMPGGSAHGRYKGGFKEGSFTTWAFTLPGCIFGKATRNNAFFFFLMSVTSEGIALSQKQYAILSTALN